MELVEVVDGYLLASIVFIFGLGLYELFAGKIDLAENSEVGALYPTHRRGAEH